MKIWSIMWTKMSPASQSKSQEMENFEQACLKRDCVQLWGFVRRTHLTHIYGEGDPMSQVNVQEAENRYNALRQGDRELVSTFKLRFDNEVKCCNGAGVRAVSDAKRALDFLYKLDAKRFKKMLVSMRNNALHITENAYPATLSAAYRIASGWMNDDYDSGFHGSDGHSAFVADSNNSATGKSQKSQRKKFEKKHTTETCFVCDVAGHYARDCSQKKVGDAALVAQLSIDEGEEDELFYDEDPEAAYVVGMEVALFTREDVLLDSQASVNVFSNKDLLHDIGAAKQAITLKGVEQGTRGVSIRDEGDFES
jgi:Zinc knuckle